MTAPAHPAALLRCEDPDLPARLARSASERAGTILPTDKVDAWLEESRQAHPFRVERLPFAEADGWSFDEATGNLGHRSGRFFTVEGLRVSTETRRWRQPIIRQPEIGILGILMQDFDGVPHFLMQAKMEPGNPNLLQLSPTVQATRSNFTGVHKGAPVRYLEYFAGPLRHRVVADVLQSEHGSWFYRKSNRNMVVEVDADAEVPLADDFCWLTLGQIHELLARDNVVNMDVRTVLSCLSPFLWPSGPEEEALTPTAELLGWLTGQRATRDIEVSRIPLRETEADGWRRGPDEIARPDGRYFSVVAVSVRAGNREVSSWHQPLFAPRGMGVAALVVREFGGVPHVLLQARAEPGFRGVVELGPTVQCVPDNCEPTDRPPLLDWVLSADPARVWYDTVHSEEGGRFLDAVARYTIVEADSTLPTRLPPEFAWFSVPQLGGLLRHEHYVSVQARTLLACLNALPRTQVPPRPPTAVRRPS
ncbi:NDP-hexose 2,3-dehydratase family protein [Streptomyces sp. NPDC046759]|uniref:NDP-hexose 2,3-dehydratase family protein n=1 Tax=Streptomyces sp. NPDC046759 TaxID=3155019 RepID=UPI0033F88AA2